MADSTELIAKNTETDNALKDFNAEMAAAKAKPTDKERTEAEDAAIKKFRERLKATREKYVEEKEKAKAAFKKYLNDQLEKKAKKKETDLKPLANMVALVLEAQSMEYYKPADDCKKEKTGPCPQALNKDQTVVKCIGEGDKGNCQCKCHAYVSIGGTLFRAEGLIQGAGFHECPNVVNDLFGAGTIQCKCVNK